MGLDRGLGDEQVLGDLPVGQAVGRQGGDPALARGQRGGLVVAAVIRPEFDVAEAGLAGALP